ncbi:MAG: GTP-binding protein [Methanoregula sp.]|nr:MAG: GTP-binding protein [Methanoregula sp.]
MISTGINGIDDMLGGGIPKGSWVLYSMEPGVDGQLFTISTLFSALKKGLSCLVVLPHTTFDIFKHDAALKLGCPLEIFNKKIVFIDAVDRERIEKSSRKRKEVQKKWEARIAKLCTENEVEVVFIYVDLINEDLGLEGALSVANTAKTSSKTTVILEHLNLNGKLCIERFIKKYTFDLIISISSAFRSHPHFDYFTLLHTSWSTVPKRSVPFVITEGNVVLYIPKIVVTGPARSGKSTFITSASDFGVSIDRRSTTGDPTTVAMDFGWLHWKDFDITLYGTPGEPRFDLVVPNLLNHAMGAVLLIDATKPTTLERAQHHIRLIKEKHLPMVVAANKADLPETMSDQEIREKLKLGEDTPIFFISAPRKSDVRLVLESLVDSITKFTY